MRVLIYKRHKASCSHRDDPAYRRCGCAIWLQWNHNGEQTRKSAKTLNWEIAEQRARHKEQQFVDADLGKAPAPGAAKRVDEAIALFVNSKRGEHLSDNTIYKHTLTLKRLQAFCDAQGIHHVKDIGLSQLTSWRATWQFNSPLVKRSWQERTKSFFKFCTASGMMPVNPTLQLAPIQVKADEANPSIRPFEPEEYEAILATVGKAGMLPEVAARVRACMQLQRWSGLSLIDAVWLTKDELIQDGDTFRVCTHRRKTGSAINNVIPAWLGEELLKVKNGSPRYFFTSGEAKPSGALSTFHKRYGKVFKLAGIVGTSHMFRHTFSVELLKAGVDIRKVSRALGHSSVTITERYYAKWNKAQQDILDGDLATAWKKSPGK
jgi:integrase/recombinase XerD